MDPVITGLIKRISLLEEDLRLKVMETDIRLKVLEENNRLRKNLVKPSKQDLWQYARDELDWQTGFDPDAWLAYYESKGWLIGKTPMKDWKAAVRTWHRGWKERNR